MTLAAPPRIAPVSGPASRPLVSVMVPVFNRTEFLPQTIESVLRQAGPPERMEIAVVDDASETGVPEEVTRRIGQGRVAFHRNERRAGLAGNWNRCIGLARGQWIHILHSDDFVCPGFYDEFARIIAAEPVQTVVFRCLLVDAAGTVTNQTPDLSGPDATALARRAFLRGTPIQCPGVVVQRSIYERMGGFRPDLDYLLDFEMWSRVVFNCRTHFSPHCLAAFRSHAESTGAALRRAASDCTEYYAVVPLLARHLRMPEREARQFAHRTLNDRCRELARAGDRAAWLRYERFYAGQLRGVVETADFVARFFRNLRVYRQNRPRRPPAP